MARIIGDYTGTTWSDFLVLPENHPEDKEFTPENIEISTELGGVKLWVPYLSAAMRSVTGKELALAVAKAGAMPVVPRGDIKEAAEIVKYVKDNAVGVGEIESTYKPVTVDEDNNLARAISKAKKTGYNNIPVINRKKELVGIFRYKSSKHDSMDLGMPITNVMTPFQKEGNGYIHVINNTADDDIKRYLEKYDLRYVAAIDDVGRLDRLVFLQKKDAYKVGGAIDTHKGWERRVENLIEAGADMIFTDTADAHKHFTRKLLESYKKLYPNGPPICGGNVVTPEGFRYLVEGGADVVKLGMGPGSICSTNDVLGVGAPPFWSAVEVSKARDEYARQEGGKYVALIGDGGIEGTDNIAVALTHLDAIMGGKIFGCFYESAGDRIDRYGNVKETGMMGEDEIVAIKIYGEASKEAVEATGGMKRYTIPSSKHDVATFQGVSGWVEYKGRFKPGGEGYTTALREALHHAGCENLQQYRERATLVRLSERAKITASPHGIQVIRD